jgi:hypothetical protein
MRKNFILLMAGIVGLAIALYFISPLSRMDSENSEIQNIEVVEEIPAAPVEAPPVEAPAKPVPPPAPAPTITKQPPAVDSAVQKLFAQKLIELGTCLETQNNVPGIELEPTLQVLIDSVRGEWGEAVISTEDWMQVEMETPDGDKKRLRVEMDFDSDTQVQRKLKFMNVGQDGVTVPISIPEDQAIEPSESLIASLETGNKILSKEKFERIYFQNGEEIVAKQKNGFITELEVNKGPKSFKCIKLNEDTADCQCLQ